MIPMYSLEYIGINLTDMADSLILTPKIIVGVSLEDLTFNTWRPDSECPVTYNGWNSGNIATISFTSFPCILVFNAIATISGAYKMMTSNIFLISNANEYTKIESSGGVFNSSGTTNPYSRSSLNSVEYTNGTMTIDYYYQYTSDIFHYQYWIMA